MLATLAYFQGVMDRRRIDSPVGQSVGPGQQLAALGLDDLVELEKPRRTAGRHGVEIDHEGPAALSGHRAEAVVILALVKH